MEKQAEKQIEKRWELSTEYQKAIEELNNIPQFMPLTGKERVEHMLSALGNPEKGLKVIHVAGTNGKGSVCAYLDSIIRECGYKVGLFTSPHLVDIRERIRIDGELVSEELFLWAYEKVKESESETGVQLAYFDYLFGIALLVYKRLEVDYCIIETGLGGRLDATNAIEGKLLNVITGVSLEHTAILGDTVEKIAAEKAGIVSRGEPVVFMDKDETVSAVVRQRADEVNSEAVEVGATGIRIIKNTGKSIDFSLHNRYYKNDCFTIATGAVYQPENCAVALTAVAYLKCAGAISYDESAVHRAVEKTYWAGRMEEVAARVYVDGAHNPEGIEAFVKSAEAIAGDNKACLFFSVVNDKDYTSMIKTLCQSGVFDMYVITQIDGSRKLDRERIKDTFVKYTDKKVKEFDNIGEAYKYVLSKRDEEDAYCFCAGSLYLVGDIKALEGCRKGEQYD